MHSDPSDGAIQPRHGEELDEVRVGKCLEERLPGFRGPVKIEQFPGGHSNLTYLVRAASGELVLRRPPFGAEHIKTGHDMSREFRILSALVGVYARAPRPLLFVAAEDSPIGAPFYVMERVRGRILRATSYLSSSLPPEL